IRLGREKVGDAGSRSTGRVVQLLARAGFLVARDEVAHRVGLSGRTAAGDVLLATAVDLGLLGIAGRSVEVRTRRDRQTARDQQTCGRYKSLVLLHVCLLEKDLSAAHRPPVRRAGSATSCAAQRRASVRARPREVIVTVNDIESIQKQTTGEAVVWAGEFATRRVITTRQECGFRNAQSPEYSSELGKRLPGRRHAPRPSLEVQHSLPNSSGC